MLRGRGKVYLAGEICYHDVRGPYRYLRYYDHREGFRPLATRSLIPLFATALFIAGAAAAADPDPSVFVQNAAHAMNLARADGDQAAQQTACATLTTNAFDLPAMVRTVSGGYWTELSEAQRAALNAAVARQLVLGCVSLLARITDATPSVMRERKTDIGINVTTKVPNSTGDGIVLVWALHAGGPWAFRATDLMVDGTSVSHTLRRDFDNLLVGRKGDIDGAITALAKRAVN